MLARTENLIRKPFVVLLCSWTQKWSIVFRYQVICGGIFQEEEVLAMQRDNTEGQMRISDVQLWALFSTFSCLFVSVHKHKRLEHIKAFCFDSSEIQCNKMYNIMCTSVLSSQYEVIDKLLYFFYNCCESYIRLMEEDKAVDTICFLVFSRKCRISWSAFIFIIRTSIFPFLSNQLCPIIWE